MIEVRIPKDIDEYKSPFFMGLQLKHCIYAGLALAIAVPNGLFGHHIMPSGIVGFVNLAVGMAFAMPIFYDLQGKGIITGEETIMNVIHFTLTRRIREYEYLDYMAAWDYAEERRAALASKKSRKRKPRKKKGK